MNNNELTHYRETLLRSIEIIDAQVKRTEHELIDVANNERRRAEARIADRQRMDQLEEEVSDYEHELSALRNRLRKFNNDHPEIQSPSHDDEEED